MTAPSGFTVDPASLRDLSRQLVVLSGNLDQAWGEIRGLDPAGFGDVRLGQATRDFAETWRWQARHLGKRLQDLSDRLNDAATNYLQVEEAQLKAQHQ